MKVYESQRHSLNRRAFLKVLGVNIAALLVPFPGLESPYSMNKDNWPTVTREGLPYKVRAILDRMAGGIIDTRGNLHLRIKGQKFYEQAPLAQTLWNREKSSPRHRLDERRRWGLVLHWFGDREEINLSLPGYLRGFNDLRQIGNYKTRTSAHFLVGEEFRISDLDANGIGIVQTQKADADGIPFLASHLRQIHHDEDYAEGNYFVKALYELGYQQPGIHSILQDFFDGPRIDPNYTTIAIEIAGHSFDDVEHLPTAQKIANVLTVVWAIMRRYRISILDVLGHHEIQLGKADPGKVFLALIRYLIGIVALVDPSPLGKQLVFGPFIAEDGSHRAAVSRYFQFVRDYLLMVSTPKAVFDWEVRSQFGNFTSALQQDTTIFPMSGEHFLPLQGEIVHEGHRFLIPENHEGVDIGAHTGLTAAQLITDGLCISLAESGRPHRKKTAIFRHRQPDGAEYLSIYSHLTDFGDLEIGNWYAGGYPVGSIYSDRNHQSRFLHFSLAYGGTWKTDLETRPFPPLNSGATWIQSRYFHPEPFLGINPAPRNIPRI